MAYFSTSISPGRQAFVKKGFSGPYKRRIVNPPLPGTVWIPLPRATPGGGCGPKTTVVEPSAAASAAERLRRWLVRSSARSCHCTRFRPGGFQLPSPGGRIDGGMSFGQYRRITR